MPREKPLAVGTVLTSSNDQYEVKRLVGGGGMAWVYQVARLSVGQNSLWALKELRPQTQDPDTQEHARKLFSQEAIILSQLNHPNLPQVIDFFEENGRAYLVMEFVWGESLEKRIEKAQSPLLEREVVQWAIQICEVLDYLHTRQPPVIFRDLKPSNMMVNNAGVIKLIDFGIARTYKEDKLQDTIALGSENYAAPEQWGEAQTDPRADIYGLGATMYHLLANMPPSPAFLPSEPVPLDSFNNALSPEVVQIVGKAMKRDRQDRYSSARELERALRDRLPDYVPPGQSDAAAGGPIAHDQQTASSKAPANYPVAPFFPSPKTTTPQKPARMGAQSASSASSPVSKPVTSTQGKSEGQPVVRKVRLCPRCRHSNNISARFCVKCGYAFVGIRPAVLRVIEPVRAAWEMPVSKSPLMLGRAHLAEGYRPDFDMTFYDPEGYVSRRHAHIIKAKNGYFIADLGSSNGTYVNDQPLTPLKFRMLRNGDKIEIGQVAIHFLLR